MRAASPSLFDGAHDVGLCDLRAPAGLGPGSEDPLPAFEARDVLAERLAQQLATTAPFRPSDAIDLACERRRERDRDCPRRRHSAHSNTLSYTDRDTTHLVLGHTSLCANRPRDNESLLCRTGWPRRGAVERSRKFAVIELCDSG
jgi:hypothetical protein